VKNALEICIYVYFKSICGICLEKVQRGYILAGVGADIVEGRALSAKRTTNYKIKDRRNKTVFM